MPKVTGNKAKKTQTTKLNEKNQKAIQAQKRGEKKTAELQEQVRKGEKTAAEAFQEKIAGSKFSPKRGAGVASKASEKPPSSPAVASEPQKLVQTPPEPQTSISDRLSDEFGDFTDSLAPHVIVEALAGCGKSTTLIEGMKRIKGIPTQFIPSPQQAAVWESMELSKGQAQSICFCAFNKAIARELQEKIPAGCVAMTLHSLGNKAVSSAYGRLKLNQYRVTDLISDILQKDIWELKKTKQTMLIAVQDLVALCKQNLVGLKSLQGSNWSDEEWEEALDELCSYYEVELNGSREEVFKLVPQVLELCRTPQCDGCFDFNDMIWLPVVNGLPCYRYDLLLVDECQDLNKCQQQLALKSGERIILCGDSNQCHPAGTLVTKTGGQLVPIESLNVGDQLATFNPNQGKLAGTKTQGRKVEAIAIRNYCGLLYDINGTECTPNHKWPTKFSEDCRIWIALYLTELEDGSFGIGQTQLVTDENGFGPGLRARQESGVKVWLLDVLESRDEAREQEFKNSLKFRVPQRAQYEKSSDSWSKDLIDEGFPPDVDGLLTLYGRLYEFPIWIKGEPQHIGSRRVFTTQACNLIPNINLIAERVNQSEVVRWSPLRLGITEDWQGRVWSLRVQPTEKDRRLYIANGNVTSNSIYGFAGADSQSMNRMAEILGGTNRGVKRLPLTVTRRCGKAIVAEAQKIVPSFEAFETNGEGLVRYADYSTYAKEVQDGDFLICRVNGPLVSQCFRFLKAGRKANIQGRDVGQGLISTVKKLVQEPVRDAADSVVNFITALDNWHQNEVKKLMAKRNPPESRLIALEDRKQCLEIFCNDVTTINQLIAKIEAIFTDNQTSGIRLSSIHKAKGLEAKRVFFLQPKGGQCPHPMAKSQWQRDGERNLLYVGETRAIEELIFVTQSSADEE